MIINDKFAGLIRFKNGDYIYDGDIYSEETIEIKLDGHLTVNGSIESLKSIIVTRGITAFCIEASADIKAGRGIESDWEITAGAGITAGASIEAGGNISARLGSIKADDAIIAGWYVTAGAGITAGGVKAGFDIKAGEDINVKTGIESDCGICAGHGIKAGYNIIAGWYINAETYIDCEGRIFAGIKALDSAESCTKDITCAELKQGEICYGNLILRKDS